MFVRIKVVITIMLGCILVYQCKKKDTQSPVITVINPSEGGNYSKGQNLNIKINFTDNDELHHVVWKITGLLNNHVIAQYDQHVDNSQWSVDTNLVINDTNNTSYLLNVETEDHSENLSQKAITFYVK